MRSAKNSCFRMLSLLLTFRKGFRKPSGTFRNAGFEHLTYGLYLQDQFGDQISLLTSPTYIPHENIEFRPVSGSVSLPCVTQACEHKGRINVTRVLISHEPDLLPS